MCMHQTTEQQSACGKNKQTKIILGDFNPSSQQLIGQLIRNWQG